MRLVFKAMILLGILLPMQVYALGVGELHTRSYLNQPFDAELALSTNNPSELSGLKVNLAPPEDFTRAGIERLPILNALRFKLEKKRGQTYIHITSQQVIREPYLNFLIEVNWSRGRLLREFTVLLDPPELLGGEAANVESPAASEPSSAASVPKLGSTVKPGAGTVVQGKKNFPLVYGPIERNEKLWNIARKMRGDIRATIPQVMMALLRNNPEAFINNNVNSVKSGFVLRIDDPNQIDAMGAAEARKEFRHQYQLWLDYKQRRAAAADKRARERELSRQKRRARSQSGRETQQQKEKQGLLTLERPRGEKPVGGHLESETVGKGKESEELVQLRKQLAQAQQSAQSNQKQNEAMHERLKAMEDQISALQRLMSVRSDELTSLQQKLATEDQGPQGKAKQEPGFVSKLAEGLSGMLHSMQKNPQITGIVGGAVLLLLITLWLLMRRRKQQAADDFYYKRAATPDGFDMPLDEPWGSEDDGLGDDWNTPSAASTSTSMDEDPITQADIFVAYGNLDAAVDVMEAAVNKWPDKGDYQHKLAELKDKRAASVTETPSEDLLSNDVAASDVSASSLEMKEEDDSALLTNEDLLAFEEALQSEDELPEAEEALLTDDDLLAFDESSKAEEVETTAEETLLTNDDLLAFEEASKPEVMAPEELDEALLTNDDLLAFEEAAQVEESKPAEPEHDDIQSAISDFGIELGEDLDLHEPKAANASKPESDDEGLEFDLNDIHSELEQLTVDEGHISASEHESAIPEFDLQELDAGLEEVSHEDELPKAPQGMLEEAIEPVEDLLAEVEDDDAIDLDLELPDEEPLESDEDLEFDTDSLIELPDHEPDLLNDVDEVGTKLDLAKAYIDMGDPEGARAILDEVLHEGNSHQIQEANKLLTQIQ